MAVPFFVPEDSVESTQSSSSTATSPNSVSTSIPSSPMPQPQPQQPTQPQGGSVTAPPTASPLMSPVNGEYLVQAFCEALYRYSRAGGWWRSPGYPISPMTPLSPSCTSSGFNNSGYYGDVFFPQNAPRSPRFDVNVETPRTSRRMRRPSMSNARRSRLTSQGNDDETDDEDAFNECFNEMESVPSWYDLDDHYHSLAAREHLQEFTGRLPQPRKKRKDSEPSPPPQQKQQKEKPKVQKFGWPKYVALGVLAVGCGFFVSR
ncbi:unnamed protein product [Diamesa hyperborea]